MKFDKKDEKILQNLKDAGCNSETIEKFFCLQGPEQLKLLAQHRIKLLDSLHKYQKMIDCLDYLIFNLRKQEAE